MTKHSVIATFLFSSRIIYFILMKKNYSREEILNRLFLYLKKQCLIQEPLSEEIVLKDLLLDSFEQFCLRDWLEEHFGLEPEQHESWWLPENFSSLTIGELADKVWAQQ